LKQIELSKGKFAIVDDRDFEYLNSFCWHLTSNGYAARRIGYRGPIVLMHRDILKAPKGLTVDHINHNKIDNRRKNIRLATYVQNGANRRKIYGNTPYKGVHFSKLEQKYKAYLDHDNRRLYLGTYDTAEEAARAYDKEAFKLKGEFSLQNFPGEQK